ncbi:MAG: TolC family protein [Campylobacterota bacterium]|nr:TolC family protein [Campylobacterota bacterium]
MRVLALLSVALTLYSSEPSKVKLDAYISQLKQEQFKLDYERIDNESSLLRDSWIMPININYTLDKSNPFQKLQTSQRAAIVMDQPIFRSGGIFYGIKFAQASREFSNLSVEQLERQVIKQAVELLMLLKKSNLQLKQQRVRLANAEINLIQKKESYLNGQLDSGFLTDAVIQKNVVAKALFDIERNTQSYLSQFKAISDMNPQNATVPHLKIISEDEFLNNNIDLNKIKSQSKRDDYNKNITIAKYLPSLNVVGGYNWSGTEGVHVFNGTRAIDDSEDKYYNFGIKATLPLNINSYNDIQVARIEYLKSVVIQEDTAREQKALFERIMQSLENYDKKIVLAKENIELYSTLYSDTQILYKAGYKTSYDVDSLKNSLEIENYEMSIIELDKQMALLTLYEKLSSL